MGLGRRRGGDGGELGVEGGGGGAGYGKRRERDGRSCLGGGRGFCLGFLMVMREYPL